MPTVTNSCDEEDRPQNSSQNLHKYLWCTTLSYSHGYFCSFLTELSTLTSGTMISGAQLSESEWQSAFEYQHHHYLHVIGCHLKLCLGNKEFELVVFGVTFAVVTRRSTSGGHGVSVLVLVTGSGLDSLEAPTDSLALLTSSTSLLSGSKNFF